MSNVIKLDLSNLGAVLAATHAGQGLSSQKAFGQTIYLLDALVAGTTHVPNIKDLEPELPVGFRLNFIREPDNPHDPRAIAVSDDKGNKFGYVPHKQNEILSRLMDAGKLIYGVVTEKAYSGKWLKITMQIFLDD
jgi:hypothetical protein